MLTVWVVLTITALRVAATDDSTNASPREDTAALQEPPPDVAQDRRPALRANMQPHMPITYDGPQPHHDQKTSGSSDYAFTYPGVAGVANTGGYEHFSGGAFDHGSHGVHHDHIHVVEDHGHHDHDHYHEHEEEYHITPRDVAFGFLTFMIILSNLQSALINLSKNTNLVGVITSRRRRDLSKLYTMNEIPDGPLPFPTKLDEKNWLLVEDKQVRCMQHSVCATNRQLARDMGQLWETARTLHQWTGDEDSRRWMGPTCC